MDSDDNISDSEDENFGESHMYIEMLCEELVGEERCNPPAFGRRMSGSISEIRLKHEVPHDVERAEHASKENRCRVCCEKLCSIGHL